MIKLLSEEFSGSLRAVQLLWVETTETYRTAQLDSVGLDLRKQKCQISWIILIVPKIPVQIDSYDISLSNSSLMFKSIKLSPEKNKMYDIDN